VSRAFSSLCIHLQIVRLIYQQKIGYMGQRVESASWRKKGSGQLDEFCGGHGQLLLGLLSRYLSIDNVEETCLDGRHGRHK
jgi:hypothetical protein